MQGKNMGHLNTAVATIKSTKFAKFGEADRPRPTRQSWTIVEGRRACARVGLFLMLCS